VAADKLEVIVEDKSVQLKLSVDPCNLKVLVVTVLENDQPEVTSISKLYIATG
jgi:Ni,Fe-hydrogenase III component G